MHSYNVNIQIFVATRDTVNIFNDTLMYAMNDCVTWLVYTSSYF